MAIPTQVRQRSSQADQLIQQHAGGQEPSRDAEQAEQEQQAAAEAQRQAAEEQAQAEADLEAAEQQRQQAVEVGDVESMEALTKKVENLQEELRKSEQRNRTLDGMIRAESSRREQMEQLLAQMQAAESESKQAPAARTEEPSASEAQDRRDFGDDYVDMATRAAQRILANVVKPLEARLEKIEGAVTSTSDQTQRISQRSFHAELTKLVPNWREIDNDPEFLDWLNASESRVALIRSGMRNYDAEAVAEMFQLYESLHSKGQPGKQDQPAAPAKPARDLSSRVAPSTGRASQGTQPGKGAQPRVWKRSEIAQVFQNRRNYSKEEFEGLQRDIFAAQQEGRVDYNS